MKLDFILDKRLIIIPILLLLFSISSIGYNYITTGNFIDKSIELRGGNQITIQTQNQIDQKEVETLLQDKDVVIRTLGGLNPGLIITTEGSPEEVLQIIQSNYQVQGYSIETVGPVLSKIFWIEGIKGLTIGFLLMATTVFIYFRKMGPSIAVILAVLTDIIMTVGAMNLFGIELSLATLGALLFLIGFSVDTNILLTTRIKKSGKMFNEAVIDGFKTGTIMTLTTVVALLAIFIAPVSSALNSISLVIIIGLLFDMINTWITNVNIIRWLK